MQIESFILLIWIVRILRMMKKTKIVAKHIYTIIKRRRSLLNHVNMYSCIYWNVFSKHSAQKYIGIIQ